MRLLCGIEWVPGRFRTSAWVGSRATSTEMSTTGTKTPLGVRGSNSAAQLSHPVSQAIQQDLGWLAIQTAQQPTNSAASGTSTAIQPVPPQVPTLLVVQSPICETSEGRTCRSRPQRGRAGDAVQGQQCAAPASDYRPFWAGSPQGGLPCWPPEAISELRKCFNRLQEPNTRGTSRRKRG